MALFLDSWKLVPWFQKYSLIFLTLDRNMRFDWDWYYKYTGYIGRVKENYLPEIMS